VRAEATESGEDRGVNAVVRMPRRIHIVAASGSGTTTLAVVPTDIRLARLRAREVERYGREAIAPGGALHDSHIEFLDWAARYDAGGLDMRSRALHEAWLAALPGATLRLEGDRPVALQLARVEAAVEACLPAAGADSGPQ
jgi:hypothetical protein